MKIEKRIHEIFDAEKRAQDTGNWTPEQLKNWDQELKELEFKLQEQAGYPQDETYHQLWFKQPLCTCPTWDNIELLGVDARYIDAQCPVHGIKNKKGS